jgi:hypothetical protein
MAVAFRRLLLGSTLMGMAKDCNPLADILCLIFLAIRVALPDTLCHTVDTNYDEGKANMGRLTTAQKVIGFQAGRELARLGVVEVEDCRGGGMILVLEDGARVHSDHIQVRLHNTLHALAVRDAVLQRKQWEMERAARMLGILN